ncbi:MAG: hypothetical protein J6C31_08060 [Prevotella sp.]|nr:hypothetical protein [Prevotella sp.]
MDYNNPNDNWKYDPNKSMTKKTGCAQVIGTVVGVIIAMVLCALLGSCTTTKYVPVIEHRTDTVRITQQQRDSLYFCDSIYTIVRTEGDTVYQQTDRWRIRYIERTSHDTIYQSKHDSIPVPYKVTEYVERKRSAMEWGLISIGTVALLGFIVWLAVRLKRFLP